MKPLNDIKNLYPLLQSNSFPFLEKTFDDIDEYAILARIQKAMNEVITNNNILNDNFNELNTTLTNNFDELKNYVNDYFKNLDVQDEIDNKLQQMANDGSLQPFMDNLITSINQQIQNQNNKINDIASMINVNTTTPKVVDSTEEMTDTSKIYVLSTNGNWYYYSNNSWKSGGVYNAQAIGINQITTYNTNFFDNLASIPISNWIPGKVFNVNSGDVQTYPGSLNETYIEIPSGYDKVIFAKPDKYSHIFFYDEEKTYISYIDDAHDINIYSIPENAKFYRISYWIKQFNYLPYDCINFDLYNSTNNTYLYNSFNYMNLLNSNMNLKNSQINVPAIRTLIKYNTQNSIVNIIDNFNIKIDSPKTSNINFIGFAVYYDYDSNYKNRIVLRQTGSNLLQKLSVFANDVGNQIGTIQFNENGIAYIDLNNTNKAPNNIYYFTFNRQDNDINCNINVNNYYFNNTLENAFTKDTLLNKKYNVLFLGDSITALTGDRGWTNYFKNIITTNISNNTAVNGAWLMDYANTTYPYNGNPTSGDQHNNVLGNQVQKVLNNNYPADIIVIAIGINGGITATYEDIYNAYYDTNKDKIPLENVDRKTSAGAFRWCNEKLHEKYPNAKIFWCTPIQTAQKNLAGMPAVLNYDNSLKTMCEFASIICVDTEKCGIFGFNEDEYFVDGLHPNSTGARLIGNYNASIIKQFLN